MSRKPETTLVGKITTWLIAQGGWWVKVHGSPFQRAGIPDIIGCYEGRFIGIEVKCPGNGPTMIQDHTMKLLKKVGARVGVAYNVQEALDIRDGRRLYDE
ncbi:MAG: VRR-NUC domain-containing protein [Ignavibacteria bacterium]|jgi:Holliday junction resolvase|nr:VRR-NUC domain-containing protein [Ignavibacteria bacterium]